MFANFLCNGVKAGLRLLLLLVLLTLVAGLELLPALRSFSNSATFVLSSDTSLSLVSVAPFLEPV